MDRQGSDRKSPDRTKVHHAHRLHPSRRNKKKKERVKDEHIETSISKRRKNVASIRRVSHGVVHGEWSLDRSRKTIAREANEE